MEAIWRHPAQNVVVQLNTGSYALQACKFGGLDDIEGDKFFAINFQEAL